MKVLAILAALVLLLLVAAATLVQSQFSFVMGYYAPYSDYYKFYKPPITRRNGLSAYPPARVRNFTAADVDSRPVGQSITYIGQYSDELDRQRRTQNRIRFCYRRSSTSSYYFNISRKTGVPEAWYCDRTDECAVTQRKTSRPATCRRRRVFYPGVPVQDWLTSSTRSSVKKYTFANRLYSLVTGNSSTGYVVRANVPRTYSRSCRCYNYQCGAKDSALTGRWFYPVSDVLHLYSITSTSSSSYADRRIQYGCTGGPSWTTTQYIYSLLDFDADYEGGLDLGGSYHRTYIGCGYHGPPPKTSLRNESGVRWIVSNRTLSSTRYQCHTGLDPRGDSALVIDFSLMELPTFSQFASSEGTLTMGKPVVGLPSSPTMVFFIVWICILGVIFLAAIGIEQLRRADGSGALDDIGRAFFWPANAGRSHSYLLGFFLVFSFLLAWALGIAASARSRFWDETKDLPRALENGDRWEGLPWITAKIDSILTAIKNGEYLSANERQVTAADCFYFYKYDYTSGNWSEDDPSTHRRYAGFGNYTNISSRDQFLDVGVESTLKGCTIAYTVLLSFVAVLLLPIGLDAPQLIGQKIGGFLYMTTMVLQWPLIVPAAVYFFRAGVKCGIPAFLDAGMFAACAAALLPFLNLNIFRMIVGQGSMNSANMVWMSVWLPCAIACCLSHSRRDDAHNIAFAVVGCIYLVVRNAVDFLHFDNKQSNWDFMRFVLPIDLIAAVLLCTLSAITALDVPAEQLGTDAAVCALITCIAAFAWLILALPVVLLGAPIYSCIVCKDLLENSNKAALVVSQKQFVQKSYDDRYDMETTVVGDFAAMRKEEQRLRDVIVTKKRQFVEEMNSSVLVMCRGTSAAMLTRRVAGRNAGSWVLVFSLGDDELYDESTSHLGGGGGGGGDKAAASTRGKEVVLHRRTLSLFASPSSIAKATLSPEQHFLFVTPAAPPNPSVSGIRSGKAVLCYDLSQAHQEPFWITEHAATLATSMEPATIHLALLVAGWASEDMAASELIAAVNDIAQWSTAAEDGFSAATAAIRTEVERTKEELRQSAGGFMPVNSMAIQHSMASGGSGLGGGLGSGLGGGGSKQGAAAAAAGRAFNPLTPTSGGGGGGSGGGLDDLANGLLAPSESMSGDLRCDHNSIPLQQRYDAELSANMKEMVQKRRAAAEQLVKNAHRCEILLQVLKRHQQQNGNSSNNSSNKTSDSDTSAACTPVVTASVKGLSAQLGRDLSSSQLALTTAAGILVEVGSSGGLLEAQCMEQLAALAQQHGSGSGGMVEELIATVLDNKGLQVQQELLPQPPRGTQLLRQNFAAFVEHSKKSSIVKVLDGAFSWALLGKLSFDSLAALANDLAPTVLSAAQALSAIETSLHENRKKASQLSAQWGFASGGGSARMIYTVDYDRKVRDLEKRFVDNEEQFIELTMDLGSMRAKQGALQARHPAKARALDAQMDDMKKKIAVLTHERDNILSHEFAKIIDGDLLGRPELALLVEAPDVNFQKLDLSTMVTKPIDHATRNRVFLAKSTPDAPDWDIVIKEHELATEEHRRGFHKENGVLQRAKHPRVVEIIKVAYSPDAEHGYIVMPRYPGGNLRDFLAGQAAKCKNSKKKNGSKSEVLTPEWWATFVRAALESLRFLHSRDIIHSDVKPGNMLVDADNLPVLTDFDASRSASEESAVNLALGVSGTVGFMAPEVVRDTAKISVKSDIFSMGKTLELAAQTLRSADVDMELGAATRFDDLIAEMTNDDPGKRPTAALAQNHSFFTLSALEREKRFQREKEEMMQIVEQEQKRRVQDKQELDAELKRQAAELDKQRKKIDFLQPPSDWNDSDVLVDSVQKIDVTAEMKEIMQEMVDATADGTYGAGRDQKVKGKYSKLEVVRVFRVENTAVWRAYATKRLEMANTRKKPPFDKNKIHTMQAEPGGRLDPVDYPHACAWVKSLGLDDGVCEVLGFHATDMNIAPSIVHGGYSEKFASLGGLFGAGVYMAMNSSKSDQYSRSNSSGEFPMFLGRMIMGTALEKNGGNSFHNKRMAPLLNDSDPTGGRYDSIFGSGLNAHYREMIVYESEQTYPAYLMYYKRR